MEPYWFLLGNTECSNLLCKVYDTSVYQSFLRVGGVLKVVRVCTTERSVSSVSVGKAGCSSQYDVFVVVLFCRARFSGTVSVGKDIAAIIRIKEEVEEAEMGVTTVDAVVRGGNPGDGGGEGTVRVVTDPRCYTEANMERWRETLYGRRFWVMAVDCSSAYIYGRHLVRYDTCVGA